MAYSRLIDIGWCPLWIGIEHDESVIAEFCDQPLDERQTLLKIKLGKHKARMYHWEVFTLPDLLELEPLRKATSIYPVPECHVYPITLSDQSWLRAASICGYGAFLRPGFDQSVPIPNNTVRRIIGLDLEQTTSLRDGSFPLPHDPLVSAAIVTWDNRYFCRTACGTFDRNAYPKGSNYDVERVKDSTELVEWIFNWIEREGPDYIAIHYGYKFDVGRVCVHASPHRASHFAERNLGMKGKGLDLSIDGCTLIDTHWFIDKVHRSDYDNMSLDAIAAKLDFVGKTEAPTMNVDVEDENFDLTDMIYYNIYDSHLHKAILEGKYIDEIENLARASRCPLFDACRYITGTMVATLLSSLALAQSRVLDWSSDGNQHLRVQGAYVFEPNLGYHADVYVFDFASMYPSVMIGGNISIESVFDVTKDYDSKKPSRKLKKQMSGMEMGREDRDGAIDWNDDNIVCYIRDKVAMIERRPESFTTGVLEFLIAERKRVGKETDQGWALKVVANSLYGASASSTSGLFSYLAGASVTHAGRWCITVVQAVAALHGFEVIYGDTDSVFLAKKKYPHITAKHFEVALNLTLSHTPFGRVKLEAQARVIDLILVGKKMYYGKEVPKILKGNKSLEELEAEGLKPEYIVDLETDFEGLNRKGLKIIVKGLAMRRKDRTPLLQDAMKITCEAICASAGTSSCVDKLGQLYTSRRERIRTGAFSPRDAVKERRKGGVTYYEFKDLDGKTTLVRPDDFNPKIHIPCRKDLINSIVTNCDSILKACDLPTVKLLEKRYKRRNSSLRYGI